MGCGKFTRRLIHYNLLPYMILSWLTCQKHWRKEYAITILRLTCKKYGILIYECVTKLI
jgi:hypothetical protein